MEAVLPATGKSARTYLAGIGATGALTATTLAVALFLAALIAFDAWPSVPGMGGSDAPSPTIEIGGAGTDAAALTALSPGAELRDTTALAGVLADSISGDAPGGKGKGGNSGNGNSGSGGDNGASTPGSGGGTVDPGTTGGGGGSTGGGSQGLSNGLNNTVNNTVNNVNKTVNGLGGTVNGTLNSVNQVVGNTLKGLGGKQK